MQSSILDCTRLCAVSCDVPYRGRKACPPAAQFQHTLQHSAEARRSGVGADTEAADDAWLRALLSIIGELCSRCRTLAVLALLLQDQSNLQLRHQPCRHSTMDVPHSAHPCHPAWALHHPG